MLNDIVLISLGNEATVANNELDLLLAVENSPEQLTSLGLSGEALEELSGENLFKSIYKGIEKAVKAILNFISGIWRKILSLLGFGEPTVESVVKSFEKELTMASEAVALDANLVLSNGYEMPKDAEVELFRQSLEEHKEEPEAPEAPKVEDIPAVKKKPLHSDNDKVNAAIVTAIKLSPLRRVDGVLYELLMSDRLTKDYVVFKDMLSKDILPGFLETQKRISKVIESLVNAKDVNDFDRRTIDDVDKSINFLSEPFMGKDIFHGLYHRSAGTLEITANGSYIISETVGVLHTLTDDLTKRISIEADDFITMKKKNYFSVNTKTKALVKELDQLASNFDNFKNDALRASKKVKENDNEDRVLATELKRMVDNYRSISKYIADAAMIVKLLSERINILKTIDILSPKYN